MTRQELQDARLRDARQERDHAALPIIHATKNSPATIIALHAVADETPGWGKRFMKLRSSLPYDMAGALDKYQKLCERVRAMEAKIKARK